MLATRRSSLTDRGRGRGQGWTPLMYAAAAGDLAAVRLLLDYKADENARDPETGATALMLAVSGGHAPTESTSLEQVARRRRAAPRKLQPRKRDGSVATSPHEGTEP